MTKKQQLLGVLSGILLLDSLILMLFGKFNLGTVLPGVLGLGGLIVLWQRRAIADLKYGLQPSVSSGGWG